MCRKTEPEPSRSSTLNPDLVLCITHLKQAYTKELTGRAALEELVPKARARALPKLPATFRGLAAPLVATRRIPGSTRPPRMTNPASTVTTHRPRAARVAPREQVCGRWLLRSGMPRPRGMSTGSR